MSSEAVGRSMPQVVTLDDLTAMMTADEFHRYELSPEGVLSVMPPAGAAHARIVSLLTVWLATAGIPGDRFAQAIGLRIPSRDGVGGRIPDLLVWNRPFGDGIWLPVTGLLLVAEVVSPGSEAMDRATKRDEYAAAGIPQYWVIEQDQAQTVTMHRLAGDDYAARAGMPLAWVLNTSPVDYGLV